MIRNTKNVTMLAAVIAAILLAVPAAAFPGRPDGGVRVYCGTGADGKVLFHGGAGASPSVGFASFVDLRKGGLLVGLGFDSGVKSRWMDCYDLLLSARAGYVIERGAWMVSPIARCGWYMDVRPREGAPCAQDVEAVHSVMGCLGMEAGYEVVRDLFLCGSLQGALAGHSAAGFSATAGVRIRLRR